MLGEKRLAGLAADHSFFFFPVGRSLQQLLLLPVFFFGAAMISWLVLFYGLDGYFDKGWNARERVGRGQRREREREEREEEGEERGQRKSERSVTSLARGSRGSLPVAARNSIRDFFLCRFNFASSTFSASTTTFSSSQINISLL